MATRMIPRPPDGFAGEWLTFRVNQNIDRRLGERRAR
jgi:hypothetical protein